MLQPLAVIAGADPRSPTLLRTSPAVPRQRPRGPSTAADHETVVLGLVPKEHHAGPAAQSTTQARHPQRHPLRDAAASLVLRLRLVHSLEDEAQEVDEEEV